MSQVINHGVIVIDLMGGKVELPVPDISPILNARKQELQLVDQLVLATERAWQAQEKLNQSAGGRGPGAMPGGFPGGVMPSPATPVPMPIPVPMPMPVPASPSAPADVDAWEKGLAILEKQNDAWAKGIGIIGARKAAEAEAADQQLRAAEELDQANKAQAESAERRGRQAMEGVTNIGEGFFRLGRAAVLFGATSEESMQKMVNSLAAVQAGFDIFRGSMQIVRGVTVAVQALEIAQNSQTATANRNTAATLANNAAAGASASVMTRVVGALGPVGSTVALVSAAVGVGAAAWKLYGDEVDDAKRAEEEHLEILKAKHAQLVASQDRNEASRQSLETERQRHLTPAAKLTVVDKQIAEIVDMQRLAAEMAGNYTTSSDPAVRAAQAEHEANMMDLERQRLEYVRERAAIEHQIFADKMRASQEEAEQHKKILEEAKRFQTEFGRLSPQQQGQLKAIDAKLVKGERLSAFDETQLRESGVSRGQRIADSIAAERGEQAGAQSLFMKTSAEEYGQRLAEATARYQKETSASTNVADEIRTSGRAAANEMLGCLNEIVRHFREAAAQLNSHENAIRSIGEGVTSNRLH